MTYNWPLFLNLRHVAKCELSRKRTISSFFPKTRPRQHRSSVTTRCPRKATAIRLRDRKTTRTKSHEQWRSGTWTARVRWCIFLPAVAADYDNARLLAGNTAGSTNRFGSRRGVTGGEFPDARDSRKTGVAPGWVILHPRRSRDRWGEMVTGLRLSSPRFLPADELRATDTLALFSTLSFSLPFPGSPSILSWYRFISTSFFLSFRDWNYISISGQFYCFGTHCYLMARTTWTCRSVQRETQTFIS